MDALGARPSWMHPETISIGRAPARASPYPYPDAKTARLGREEASPFFLSMNGAWRFRMAERPQAVAADFIAPGCDDSGWVALPAPSNWTMRGYDRPHYTNVRMPFPGVAPPRAAAGTLPIGRRGENGCEGPAGRRPILELAPPGSRGAARTRGGVWAWGL